MFWPKERSVANKTFYSRSFQIIPWIFGEKKPQRIFPAAISMPAYLTLLLLSEMFTVRCILTIASEFVDLVSVYALVFGLADSKIITIFFHKKKVAVFFFAIVVYSRSHAPNSRFVVISLFVRLSLFFHLPFGYSNLVYVLVFLCFWPFVVFFFRLIYLTCYFLRIKNSILQTTT